MGKYKVLYFPITGRGEPIRMTLAAAGIDFEDERITFEQWATVKPTIPSRQLPALYTPDGKILSQSVAICRFIARQHGLYSNDDWEVYYMEQMIGIYEDLFMEAAKIHFSKDEVAKETMIKEFKETKGPNNFRQIAERLEEVASKGGFLAGTNKPTLADVMFVSTIDFLGRSYGDLIGKYPTMAVHKDKVVTCLPKLAEYIEKRPETSM